MLTFLILGTSKRAHTVPSAKTIGKLTKLVARVTHTKGDEHTRTVRQFARTLHLPEVVRRHTAEIISTYFNVAYQCDTSSDPYIVALALQHAAAGKRVAIYSNDSDLRLLALQYCDLFVVPSRQTMRVYTRSSLIAYYRSIWHIAANIDDATLIRALTHVRRITGSDETPKCPVSIARALASLLNGTAPRDVLENAISQCTDDEQVRE